MSQAFLCPLVIAGLLVVVTRRRSAGIALLALQSLLLGIYALTHGGGTTAELVAGIVLVVKALALPTLLTTVASDTREPTPLSSEHHPSLRLVSTLAAAALVAVLLPDIATGNRQTQETAAGLIVIGIAIAATRGPLIFQALGFIVAENGVYVAALAAGGIPAVIELGLAFDLIVVVSVAGAFGTRIHTLTGSSDTHRLRGTRD